MTELQANFTLEPQQPINASFELGDLAPIEATFSLDVQGITEHNLLSNRDLPDQHPIDAITGLRDELDNIITGADKHFVFEQGIASDTWVIEHNLNKYPSVTVVDTAGNQFIPAVKYIDENKCIVTMNGATKGKAFLN